MSETCQGLFYFGFAARRTHDVRINAVTAGNALLQSSLLFFASLCFALVEQSMEHESRRTLRDS